MEWNEDFDVDELDTNVKTKRPKKSSDEIFKEEQFEKRCQFVRLSKSSSFQNALEFLKLKFVHQYT